MHCHFSLLFPKDFHRNKASQWGGHSKSQGQGKAKPGEAGARENTATMAHWKFRGFWFPSEFNLDASRVGQWQVRAYFKQKFLGMQHGSCWQESHSRRKQKKEGEWTAWGPGMEEVKGKQRAKTTDSWLSCRSSDCCSPTGHPQERSGAHKCLEQVGART